MNKANRDGYVTLEEIELFLRDSHIVYNTSDLHYLLWTLDHDGDGRVSYWDLLFSILPRKKCKQYRKVFKKENIKNVSGGLDPPDEVIEQTYVDDNGQLSFEAYTLWRDQLDTALEFALKRYFIAQLGLHRNIDRFNAKFLNYAEQTEENDNSQRKLRVDLSKLLLNLIEIKKLTSRKSSTGFNQKISRKTIKIYLKKFCKEHLYSDWPFVRAIFRRFDHNMDGAVTIDDYVKTFSDSDRDLSYNMEVVNRLMCKIKYDEEEIFSKSLKDKYEEILHPKNKEEDRPKSSQPKGTYITSLPKDGH